MQGHRFNDEEILPSACHGPSLVSPFADVTIGRGMTVKRMVMMMIMMMVMMMMVIMTAMVMMITFSGQCLLTSREGGRVEVAVDKVENKQ